MSQVNNFRANRASRRSVNTCFTVKPFWDAAVIPLYVVSVRQVSAVGVGVAAVIVELGVAAISPA
jgi:hypothetical protein